MQITVGKIISLLIAIGYVVAIAFAEGITIGLLKVCIFLLLPLALIWFPEEIGGFIGYVGRGGNIDTETPPILVTILGWFFLIGLPVLIYFLAN